MIQYVAFSIPFRQYDALCNTTIVTVVMHAHEQDMSKKPFIRVWETLPWHIEQKGWRGDVHRAVSKPL